MEGSACQNPFGGSNPPLSATLGSGNRINDFANTPPKRKHICITVSHNVLIRIKTGFEAFGYCRAGILWLANQPRQRPT